MIDDEIKQMIVQGKDVKDIYLHLKNTQGYKTLKQQAVELVKEGVTTIEEMRRILI